MTQPAPATWDFRALLEPISRAQLRSWRRDNPALRASVTGSPKLALALLPLLLLPLIAITSVFWTTPSDEDRPSVGMLVFVAVFAVVAAAAVVASVNNWLRRAKRAMRMYLFAQANGLTFSSYDPDPHYPGAIFQLGRSRQLTDHLTRTTGRFLDLGNYRYTTGSGKNRSTRAWGFLALRLDRRLPNMVLDSRSNNLLGMSNLPVGFARDQQLSLEGDFDEHFTLYCPREYERDALYVFTPDLMALLIDEAGDFDVEIVDDWMFVYANTPFTLADAPTLQRLFRIVDTVGAKTLSQTDRYADERIGDPAVDRVAPQGARLRRGDSWVAALVIVAFLASWIWLMVHLG